MPTQLIKLKIKHNYKNNVISFKKLIIKKTSHTKENNENIEFLQLLSVF